MTADTRVLSDLLARDRRRPETAIAVPATGRSMSYHDFITTAYKAGNALRYLGVRRGALVVVDPEAIVEPLLAFFGAAQLGAAVRFDAPPLAIDESGSTTPGEQTNRPRQDEEPTRSTPKAVLVPASKEATIDPPPGCRLVAYGDSPTDPATAHWEEIVWSENPGFPDPEDDPETTVLLADGHEISQGTLCAAARSIAEELSLGPELTLAVPTSIADPRVLAGGLAGLSAGATVTFADGADLADDELTADRAIVPAARGTNVDPSVEAAETWSGIETMPIGSIDLPK